MPHQVAGDGPHAIIGSKVHSPRGDHFSNIIKVVYEGFPAAELVVKWTPRRVSTVVVQRFCKPKAGGSIPSPGTSASY
jgi:hypothetical protein